jgi:hypothetical protein
MINAIDDFNGAYYSYLQNPNNTTIQNNLSTSSQTMLNAIQIVTQYIGCNPKLVQPPINDYDDVIKKREKVMNQVSLLKSMNGAPKQYNESNNMYDEYSASYNYASYLYIFLSILFVIAIYFLFKTLTS